LLASAGCRPASTADASGPFTDGALRLDLRHSIRNGSDEFQLARIQVEPHWRAPQVSPEQVPDWGDYRLIVSDGGGDRLLFRAGFDSNIDPEARAAATQLTARMPMPRVALHASIEKRRVGRVFQPVWKMQVDPSSSPTDLASPALSARAETILHNGPAASKVDLAIVGDGYREAEFAKFRSDAQRAVDALFSVEPFTARKRDFNVHSVFVPSPQSGATDAYRGVTKRTAFGSAYGSGEAERTLAVRDQHVLYEAASAVPYDFVLVLVNAQRYGGSAYFGGPAVVAADSAATKYLVLHELAHVIGGLAEEYYIPTPDGPTFRGNVEPWHPNVTISLNEAKWRGVTPATEVRPQRWNKAEYERAFADYVTRYSRLRASGADERAIEKLMSAERNRQAALLGKNIDRRRVGYFEGASGFAKGVFRSEVDCIMFSLQTDYFCRACASSIEQAVDLYTVSRSGTGTTAGR
jgi:hypothetical protein